MKNKFHLWRMGFISVLLAGFVFFFYTDLYLLLLPAPADEDAAILQAMASAKIPGAAVLIIRDGQVESSKGYGVTDPVAGRAVTPDTIFTIASISKTVTATALMTLYEQGGFGLDDDINNYLPFDVRNPNFPDAPITFRMLLMHTSSLEDSDVYNQYYTLLQEPVLPDSPIPLGDYLKAYLTPDGNLYNERDNFLDEPPGAMYSYSNTGFGLIGYLIEQISGMSFDRYCKQAVFAPLGMDNTAWRFTEVSTETMAVPYGYNNWLRQPKPYDFYGYPTYPDGALKTSVNEYARFLSVFINEGKTFEGDMFLKPETVQEMLAFNSLQGMEAPQAIGFAWHFDGEVYFHSGGDPGIATMAFFSPDTNSGAILFTNGGGDSNNIPGLARLMYFMNRVLPILKMGMGME